MLLLHSVKFIPPRAAACAATLKLDRVAFIVRASELQAVIITICLCPLLGPVPILAILVTVFLWGAVLIILSQASLLSSKTLETCGIKREWPGSSAVARTAPFSVARLFEWSECRIKQFQHNRHQTINNLLLPPSEISPCERARLWMMFGSTDVSLGEAESEVLRFWRRDHALNVRVCRGCEMGNGYDGRVGGRG